MYYVAIPEYFRYLYLYVINQSINQFVCCCFVYVGIAGCEQIQVDAFKKDG